LIVYLSGATSWLTALVTAVVVNIAIMLAVVIRTAALRSHKSRN
jgi:hypothetical protein